MTVLVDKNVITNLARGNPAIAEALKRCLASGEPIYMSRSAYSELVNDSPIHLRMGYTSLLRDLKLQVAPDGASSITDRGSFYGDNAAHEPKPNQTGPVKEYGNGKSKEKPGDAFVAAEARALNARLWTMDRNFAKRAANLGVTLARECDIQDKRGDEDIAQARRLMGLKPTSMLQNQPAKPIVTKTAPSGPQSANTAKNKATGNEKATKSEVGAPLEAVPEYGPNQAGDAKFQAGTLGLEGVNLLLQKFNNAIQARRFQAEFDKILPEIKRRMADDPQLGALVSVGYSKGPEDSSSVIESVTVFQNIRVGYGLNRADATRDLNSRASMLPGRSDVGQELWLKPSAPTDISRLRLPFDTTIAGLATFVPGKEKLVRVAFKGVAGFDDKFFSKEELSVPAGMTPRFYYLWPPDQITFRRGVSQTISIDWEMSDGADVTKGDVDPFSTNIPVVKLDSSINPFDATAAMVWPADNSTANLFQKTRPTQDNYGMLSIYGIGMMRWVRPEFIRILKAPFN
ncbi:PIN domain-containing protein [Bradyrhizobium prioriisuperbiae]|uniref:PIN domain-containing protein n=1 Tax=Bradyrhizobium prioriisuperbiae TaxID=2854389 RepID=UPI0028EFD8AB|nr:PIN domain-containing protein [Bradyrhizobium prioritasuperba]